MKRNGAARRHISSWDAAPTPGVEFGSTLSLISWFQSRPGCRSRGQRGRHAPEKMRAFKAHKQTGPGVKVRFEFSRQRVSVNQYYFYVHDRDWGPGL